MSTDTTPAGILDRPEKPSFRRYFPGWTMLGIAAAAHFMSAPGQSYSVAAFKEPMRATLGISETDYSLAYGLATIVSGLSLPIVGRLLDRWGARRLLPVIGLMLGGGCLLMSTVDGHAGLFVGFSLIRALGQGALSLVATWLVGEWFHRRRGFATALAGFGGSLSVMCFPLLNSVIIAQLGWRSGWVVLATAVWAVLVVPGWLLIRDRPEDLGLQPDGDEPPDRSDPQALNGADNGSSDWGVLDVLRDVTFWKLVAVPTTSGMVGTGLVFHQVSLLGSRGVPAEWALGLISLQAAIATCAALKAGALSDRLPDRILLAAAMGLLASAVSLLLVLPAALMALVYAVLLGLHGSILRSTGMVVWMTYYGRRQQGAIRGVAMAAMILGAAAGPLPIALSIDRFGSFDPALWLFIAIPVTAGLLVWTAGPPRAFRGSP